MKRMILALGFLLVSVSQTHAQDVRVTTPDGLSSIVTPQIPVTSGIDYYTPLFGGYLDYEPLAPTPCGESRVVKSATPIVFDGTLMVLYVCTNAGTYENPGQTTIWRRYFRPGNQDAAKPLPVYLVNPLTGTPVGSQAPVLGQGYPGPVLYVACESGFVRTAAGCARQ
jgi:hypothetical protein